MNSSDEMTLDDLTEYMSTLPIMLSLNGDQLRFSTPRSELTDELEEALTSYAPEVIQWIKGQQGCCCGECRFAVLGDELVCMLGVRLPQCDNRLTWRYCTSFNRKRSGPDLKSMLTAT